MAGLFCFDLILLIPSMPCVAPTLSSASHAGSIGAGETMPPTLTLPIWPSTNPRHMLRLWPGNYSADPAPCIREQKTRPAGHHETRVKFSYPLLHPWSVHDESFLPPGSLQNAAQAGHHVWLRSPLAGLILPHVLFVICHWKRPPFPCYPAWA